MGRGRVEVRRIENAVSRQVTFSKRRRGLAKKARELAVLCDAEVAMIVFSDKGRLHDFTANARVDQILDRYERYMLSEAGDVRDEHPSELQANMSYENIKLISRIEALQRSERNLMGEQLDILTLREVQQLEQQIETALRNIRSRKDSMLFDSIRELQKKERSLMEQNSVLEEEKAELDTYLHRNSTSSSTETAPVLNLNTCCTDDSEEPSLEMAPPPPRVASGGHLPWWMLQTTESSE